MIRRTVFALLIVLVAPPAFAGDEPSVKAGAEEIDQAIKDDVKEGYDKTKDATEKDVGTALDKTGQGMGKAGDSIEGAGEKVKDKAE